MRRVRIDETKQDLECGAGIAHEEFDSTIRSGEGLARQLYRVEGWPSRVSTPRGSRRRPRCRISTSQNPLANSYSSPSGALNTSGHKTGATQLFFLCFPGESLLVITPAIDSKMPLPILIIVAAMMVLCAVRSTGQINPSEKPNANAPVVTKVEPPSWWINLTSEVMLLVTGHHLEATEVACNLRTIVVERTRATAGGDYLFVWLKIGTGTKSGTVVCRATTPTGTTSFELPLANRAMKLGRFQGLSREDVIYLIMPDRFANGDPSNDEPAEARGMHDRSNPRAYHGGDLRGIREHLPYLKDLGLTTLWLTPILKNGAAQDYHGYGAVDLYAVDPHFGTIQDYQELVAAAHKQGMKIFFDLVPNHVGPKNPWVIDPPLPDWFHGTSQHHADSSAGIKGTFYGKTNQQVISNDPFEELVDPHAPPRLSRNLTEGWFFNILPDLNTENPTVAEFLLQNSIWWAETSGLTAIVWTLFPMFPGSFGRPGTRVCTSFIRTCNDR